MGRGDFFCRRFCSFIVWVFYRGKLSKVTLARFISEENQRKIGQFIHDYGMGTIMITRLSSFSNDGLSLVAGVLKMEYKKYITATLIGITPLIVLLAIFGKNEKIEWALIWIAAASLVMLVVYIVIDKKRKKKKRRRCRRWEIVSRNLRPEMFGKRNFIDVHGRSIEPQRRKTQSKKS